MIPLITIIRTEGKPVRLVLLAIVNLGQTQEVPRR